MQDQTTIVTVHPLPVVEVLPVTPSVCEGDSVLFVADGATSYDWDFDSNPLEISADSAFGPLSMSIWPEQ